MEGLKSSLVGRLETPEEGEKKVFGTVYAISEGLILTAHHVFPDINDVTKSEVVWQRSDESPTLVSPVTKIIFQSPKYDIVIAACRTPEHVKRVDFCGNSSQLTEVGKSVGWESIGFPKAGKVSSKKNRFKEPVEGTFAGSLDDCSRQALNSTVDINEADLWKGISGAPVFITGTNFLVGIILKTPENYLNSENVEKPVFKNRLYALSFPYLNAKYPKIFQELKDSIHQGSSLDEKEEQEGYFLLVEQILDQTKVFVELQRFCSNSSTSTRDIFDSLVSLSVEEFLERLEVCQKRGICKQTLGELAAKLLPMFVNTDVVERVRNLADTEVVEVPYFTHPAIESLMARVDGSRTEFLNISGSSNFVASYELPNAPETGCDDDHRIKTMGQDLNAQFGQDLQCFSEHTRYLLRDSPLSAAKMSLSGEEETNYAKSYLKRRRKKGKRSYYLTVSDDLIGTSYHQKLKQVYPHCFVLRMCKKNHLQELEDYETASTILAPYLNQKQQDDS